MICGEFCVGCSILPRIVSRVVKFAAQKDAKKSTIIPNLYGVPVRTFSFDLFSHYIWRITSVMICHGFGVPTHALISLPKWSAYYQRRFEKKQPLKCDDTSLGTFFVSLFFPTSIFIWIRV